MARQGAARVFFDVVGIFQAEKFLTGTKTSFLAWKNITNAIMLDAMTGISEAFEMFGEQFRNIIDATVPLAESFAMARIEFTKFARSIEDANIEEMGEQVRALGEGYAFTADASYEAAGRMSQLSGMLKSQAAILAATEGSLKFGFVGGMESEQAAKRMIQLQAQTGFMFGELTQEQYNLLSAQQQAALVTQNLEKTMTSLNTIENRSAATMSQLTFVMNQFASSAQLAGDSIEDMAAMSAVLIESGEEQGKAGRALRIIYARLGADMSNNNAILEHYIGNIKDANGNIASLSEIMDRLSDSWETMESAQKLQLAQAIAGNDHYVRFIKLMDGYNRKVELTTQAMQGLDSVTEEMGLFTGDAAFQLKMLNAEITNTQEMIGQDLLPVTIAMKKAELELLGGVQLLVNIFGDFVDNDKVAFIITLTKKLSDLSKGGFETYLNIKNMNVAMQTQILILRALTGEKFIQINPNQANYQATMDTLDAQQKRLQIEYKLSTNNLQQVEQNKFLLESKQQLLQTTDRQVQAETHLSDLLASGGLLHNSIVRSVDTELDLLYGITAEEKKRLDIVNQSKFAAQQRLAATAAMGQTSVRLDDRSLALSLRQIQTDQQALATATARQTHDEVSAVIAKDVLDNRLQILRAEAESLDKGSERYQLLQKEYTAVQELKMVWAGTGGGYDEEEMQMLRERITAVTELAEREIRLRAADESLILTEDELRWAMEQVSAAIREMTFARDLYDDDAEYSNELKRQEISLNGEIADSMHRIKAARAGDIDLRDQQFNDENSKELDKFKTKYNNLSASVMAMGAAAALSSLAFGALGDKIGLSKEESAAAAITSMTLAMIPAQLHMFYMTASMMVAEGVAISLNAALLALARTTLIMGVAVFAISYLIAKLAGAKAETSSYADEQERLNSALSNFNDLIASGEVAEVAKTDTRSFTEVQDALAELTSEYSTFMDAYDASNAAQKLGMEDKKKALEDELMITQGLFEVRKSEAWGGWTEEDFNRQLTAYDNLVAYNEEVEKGRNPDRIGGGRGGASDADYALAHQLASANRAARIEFEKNNQEWIAYVDNIGRGELAWNSFHEQMMAGYVLGQEVAGDMDESITETSLLIDDATESLNEFSGAAEEFFYGGSASFATGDLLKQIVTKGAENLIQNTELLMTNNFYGLTLPQMVEAVADGVTDELVNRGVVPG